MQCTLVYVNESLDAYLPCLGLQALQSDTTSLNGIDVNVEIYSLNMVATRGKCSINMLWGLFFKNDTLMNVLPSSMPSRTYTIRSNGRKK